MTLHEQIDELENRFLARMRVDREQLLRKLQELERTALVFSATVTAARAAIDRSVPVNTGRSRRRRGEDAEPSPYSGTVSDNYCDGECSHCGAPQRNESMTCRNCNAD